MTSQRNHPYRTSLSIASPSEIERTARQLTTIRKEFLTEGTLASYTPRPIILNSWQRCDALHVNPARRYAPLAIARESQLQNVREANEILVRATYPVMSHLADFLADSGYVVVLSDAKGCLLDVVGDVAIRRRLARIDFVPGGDWSEAAAGTNAIGTALADGHIVQLMAAEHYCDGWQDLTCTATPLRHPLTGEIIGILDITGDYHLVRSFLTNTLAEAALQATQQMRTILTSNHAKGYATYDRGTIYSLPGNMSSLSFPRNGKSIAPFASSTTQESPADLSFDEMRMRLDQQERKTRDAERLAIASGVINASLDLQVALEKVAEQLAHLLRLECAAVCLFAEKDTGDTGGSVHIWSKQQPLRSEAFSTMETLLGPFEAISLIRERGEPVIIDDILTSPLIPSSMTKEMGIHSLAMFPLTTARGVIGFIVAPRYTVYHWSVEDVRLGLAFAIQSATAIENASLFETLQQHNRHVEALNAMAQLLNSLPNPGQHFDVVLARIAEIMCLDVGMIWLIDKDVNRLNLVAHYGQPENILSDYCDEPIQPLHDLARSVALSGEAILISDLTSDGHIVHVSLDTLNLCDLMVVPLAASGTITGVLLFGSYSARGLTELDLALFKTVGQQLAMALKNAQLLRAESDMEILREADRLKSGFLAAISHDLRSPLTAIRASVEGLLDSDIVQSVREQQHLLQNIASQAGRLGRLVDQLLDLSKIEAGVLSLDREWTELPALFADTIKKFVGLNKGCEIEQRIILPLPLHYVDPDCLIQVLWNLLENAYKFAPVGSAIKVTAKWTGTEVLVGVSDRGPTIPMEEREKIFERFYRLDRNHKTDMQGSGLGLAICRGIVEAHGGRIWVEDQCCGEGSVFYFTLPLSAIPPIELETLEETALLCDDRTEEKELYGPRQTAYITR